MCGIAGVIDLNQKKVSDSQVRSMIGAVKHRGPDAEGFFVHENVVLGSCRLSIIDLSAQANQPMASQDGLLHIVYNGEIYNYLELKKELQALGHQFKTKSDTEVILHTYLAFGEQGFAKFNGDWAFALYDIPKKKVILSRDRFSVKPLYYTKQGNILYFGSEIKQLLPYVSKKDLNKEVMYRFLKQGLLEVDEQTFFAGIHKVKPKHNLTINLSNGAIGEEQYWSYQVHEVSENLEAAADHFRELFYDAVRIRLRSDVQVGGLLSGGLDSSIIALVANELTSGNFKSFSVVSNDATVSEEKFIDVLKEKTGIKSTKLMLDSHDIWQETKRALEFSEEPFASFSVVAQYQLMQLVKQKTGLKVLLTGQGGDELLLGYRKFFFFYLQQELRRGHIATAFENALLSFAQGTIMRQVFLSGAQRYSPLLQKFRHDPLDDLLKIKYNLQEIGMKGTVRDRQIADIDRFSIPSITHHEDRNSMANSIEVRLPFLDYRLVNYVLSLPDSYKIHNGWTKYIARKAFTELPREILWRKDKQGFVVPEQQWLQKDFKDAVIALFGNSKLHKFGIIDKDEFLKVYNRFTQSHDTAKEFYDLRRFVLAELWMQQTW